MDLGQLLHLINQWLDSPIGLIVLAGGLLVLHIPAGFLSGWIRIKGFDPEDLGALVLLAVFAYIGTAAVCACLFFVAYIPVLAVLTWMGFNEVGNMPLTPFLVFCLILHIAAQGSIHIIALRRGRTKGDR